MARTSYPLNHNWLYHPKFTTKAVKPDFDDSAFTVVTIPHTNLELPWHSFDEKSYQFVSVYRRHFKLPQDHQQQRIFIDFDGVMTAAEVFLNGKSLGTHLGGYTPFSFEITDRINWNGDNVLAVKVDSSERSDIPPFGGYIDYLTFGGLYRGVAIRAVEKAYIQNIFAQNHDVLTSDRSVEVRCYYDGITQPQDYTLVVSLLNGRKKIAKARQFLTENDYTPVFLYNIPEIELWNLDNPKLYNIQVDLLHGKKVIDTYTTRFGFRHAEFTPQGFHLNGKCIKLRGLNRHQTYPYVGQAMPDRVQSRDADILKNELKCNVVRTSHYPQSPAFLDRCDEIGLLVFEEIPGWQHIGDKDWQKVACQNVAEMVQRDWNHPSIILWGVRINESPDNNEFYARTNEIAHNLDDSRQTGGVRCFMESELLEDVFTINDFDPDKLHRPFHPLYLNTEFCGHMYSTKHYDNVERILEHTARHARVHNMLASHPRYAGGIGWCAFDYNTHLEFGSGDRMCYHGVSDIFRLPKPAAGFYRSQCDPDDQVVLEPAFHWSLGDQPGGGGVKNAMVCSNCDTLKFYLGDILVATLKPDKEQFPHLKYPPFVCKNLTAVWGEKWEDLRIEGFIKGKLAITRKMSSYGIDRELQLILDDDKLVGNGIDATRLAFRVTDEYGNYRPFATGAIKIDIEGPGEIIGENPFALAGGCGAVWIKTKQDVGTINLTITHPYLGSKNCKIKVTPAAPVVV